MSDDAPLRIGLSARLLHDPPAELGFRGKTLQYLEQSVAHWIMSHGALALMVPTTETGATLSRAAVSMRHYVQALDGLVFQGGADVSPKSYGEEALRPEWSGDRARDQYEIELFWECVIQRKPVLGICRGIQLINVALGGSLWQDIAQQIPGTQPHVDWKAYDAHTHDVAFVPGSGLGRLYAMSTGGLVTSIHHQALNRLGRGLVVEATSVPDGVVEAVRWNGSSYVVGVQWHPEFHDSGGRDLLDCSPILAEFLDSARATRSQSA